MELSFCVLHFLVWKFLSSCVTCSRFLRGFPFPSYVCIPLTTAGLRRSFRLRRDRQGSPGEAQTPEANHTDFLIYEEVTQYLPRTGDRPRLVVLIGTFTVGFGDTEGAEAVGHFNNFTTQNNTLKH